MRVIPGLPTVDDGSTEGATGAWEFLSGRSGYVQAEAASVFDRVFNGRVASAVEVGCWSHSRRKLTELQDMDCRVAYPLKLIARLYRIEHLADAKGLSPDERAALRQERSQPVLEKLRRWLAATHGSEPPASDLAKAAAYMINHWVALTRFVQDGRLKLDNNFVYADIGIVTGMPTPRLCRSTRLPRRDEGVSASAVVAD